MGLEEHRVQGLDHRKVEPVEPEHVPATAVGVIVPVPRGREHQVTRVHVTWVTVHGRPYAGALEHEADGARAMPVRGGGLPRPEALQATPQRSRRIRLAAQARVAQAEYPALAAAI